MVGKSSPNCAAWNAGDWWVVRGAMVFLSLGQYTCCVFTCGFLAFIGMLKVDLYSLPTKPKPSALVSPALAEHLFWGGGGGDG